MDFLELMDFVAYDLEKAHEMLKDAVKKEKERREKATPTIYIVIVEEETTTG